MNIYKFNEEEVQKEWEAFRPLVYRALREIGEHMPKRPNPKSQEIEELIRYIMDKRFEVSEHMGKIEEFRDLAYAEVMMDLWEANPKQSTTLMKAEADGKISSVTGLHAFTKHIWSSLEGAMMGAQSLLRAMP